MNLCVHHWAVQFSVSVDGVGVALTRSLSIPVTIPLNRRPFSVNQQVEEDYSEIVVCTFVHTVQSSPVQSSPVHSCLGKE